MIKRNIWLIGVLTSVLISLETFGNEKPATSKALTIATIPYSLEVGAQAGETKINNNELSLTAFKGSDLFTETDGASPTDTAPRV